MSLFSLGMDTDDRIPLSKRGSGAHKLILDSFSKVERILDSYSTACSSAWVTDRKILTLAAKADRLFDLVVEKDALRVLAYIAAYRPFNT